MVVKPMNLFAAIAVYLAVASSAFTPPLAGEKFRTSLFTSSSDDDADATTCGPGFKRVVGADGPCCAYDFDAMSSKLTPGAYFENDPALLSKFEEKNAARRNFALPPLTPGEFVVLQAQIHAMEREQDEIQSRAKRAMVEERERQRLERAEAPIGSLQSFVEGIFEDTCQSNFDCERPEVCCDFRFKKVCCSSGSTNRNIENELALIPVPQTRGDIG